MASLRVECLRCGEARLLEQSPSQRLDAGECLRCQYVGWAPSAELTETIRESLRIRPLERRRLRPA
jgi:hypothetical protein